MHQISVAGNAPITSEWSTIVFPTEAQLILEVWWYYDPGNLGCQPLCNGEMYGTICQIKCTHGCAWLCFAAVVSSGLRDYHICPCVNHWFRVVVNCLSWTYVIHSLIFMINFYSSANGMAALSPMLLFSMASLCCNNSIHSGKTGNLFLLLLCSLWWVQIVGYVLACRSYSFICTLHHLIIIIVQILSEDTELIKCLPDIICRVCE